jgi:hypothetical protein
MKGPCAKFLPNERAVPDARRLVEKTLCEWGRERLIGDALLVTSELVTNAVHETWRWERERRVEHFKEASEAALMESAGAGWGWSWVVGVGVYRAAGDVVIETWDCSRKPPLLDARKGGWRQSGRGLLIVSELAKRWGFRWLRPGGKIVYAVMGGE